MDHIRVNNLEFAYLSYGEAENPLIICLHGFPDSAHTWAEMGPRLAELDYFVVAPFLRGYAPSGIPQNGDYSPFALGSDALLFIEAFGRESAVIIGHDWGALAAYTAANLNPRAVSKLITLAIPHPRSLTPSFSGLWRARHFITFQFRNSARRYLSRNNMGGVDDIYQRWAPTWQYPASETAYIKESFRSPERLDAALGYYWSFREQSEESRKATTRKTSVPTLCLVGSVDGALAFDAMGDTPTCYTAEYQYHVIPNIGHFPHREAPNAVFNYMANFLRGIVPAI